MEIKVLGKGCPNCLRLEKNVNEALETLNKQAEVIKVTDITEIISYGVLATPALVVDGKVLFSGQVPSVSKLEELFK